jgi:preprotein translocase subunit SecG
LREFFLADRAVAVLVERIEDALRIRSVWRAATIAPVAWASISRTSLAWPLVGTSGSVARSTARRTIVFVFFFIVVTLFVVARRRTTGEARPTRRTGAIVIVFKPRWRAVEFFLVFVLFKAWGRPVGTAIAPWPAPAATPLPARRSRRTTWAIVVYFVFIIIIIVVVGSAEREGIARGGAGLLFAGGHRRPGRRIVGGGKPPGCQRGDQCGARHKKTTIESHKKAP